MNILTLKKNTGDFIKNKMDKEIKKILFREKPLKIFMLIERYGISSTISRKIGCTYSHAVKIIDKYNIEGLVEKKREGREKKLKYTDKGRKLFESLQDLGL